MAPRGRCRLSIATALVAAFVVLAGCGGGAKPPAVDVAAAPWEVSAESPLGKDAVTLSSDSLGVFSPDSLAVGREVRLPAEGAGTVGSTAPPPASGEAVQVPEPKDFTEGWRVQVSAYTALADADARARGARAKFTEPVYVEYEPPFFKVRVGDFLTRAEAESMATRARAEGFEGAWVVETLVLRPKR